MLYEVITEQALAAADFIVVLQEAGQHGAGGGARSRIGERVMGIFLGVRRPGGNRQQDGAVAEVFVEVDAP